LRARLSASLCSIGAVADPILVRFQQESWIFDREIGLSPAQILADPHLRK